MSLYKPNQNRPIKRTILSGKDLSKTNQKYHNQNSYTKSFNQRGKNTEIKDTNVDGKDYHH